jgi:hypothetical protein
MGLMTVCNEKDIDSFDKVLGIGSVGENFSVAADYSRARLPAHITNGKCRIWAG